MQYSLLKRRIPDDDRSRVVAHLQRLIAQLDRDIPDKDSERNLLLATWNIRDLGKEGGWGHGERLPESLFYIAEIISRFDFVAVQEVNELGPWHDIMDILGPDWDFIATDVTHSALGGNGERLLYAFDKRKVWFQKVAGEIVLPANMLISATTGDSTDRFAQGKQFRRTPFMARFQSGWFKFDICTVHLYYGAERGEKLRQRIDEIDRVADYLSKLAMIAKDSGRATILLGDFNIVHPEHETMRALKAHGFKTPKRLDAPNNLDRTKYYDQIAFIADPSVIEYIDGGPAAARNAGMVEIFESVFRPEDLPDYRPIVAATTEGQQATDLATYYAKDWRTWQISDHKPLWVRLNTHHAARYLASLAAS
jgi:endonuclease/exonuclease/phosphatase family metal-dependent hydrolase